MFRYRHTVAHPVYWPAFADILSVVVVILICALAIGPPPRVKGERSSKDEINAVVESPAATETEFRSEILRYRSECLKSQLESQVGHEVMRSGPAIRICSFSTNNDRACRQSLGTIISSLGKTRIEQLESKASLDVMNIFVRANTGYNSQASAVVKALLSEAHEEIRTRLDPSWSSRLRDQVYEEKGASGRESDLTLILVPGLRKEEYEAIHRSWPNKLEWPALEHRRQLARRCEVN